VGDFCVISSMKRNSRYFTDAIKVLISVNVILFLFRIIAKNHIDLVQIFGLSSESIWPMVWQPLTYMFIHADFFHIFMNMFILWMCGSSLESIWGRDGFIKYYFITGIGSGLIWLLFNINNPFTIFIGASGATYGLLLAYGLMLPNHKYKIYFAIFLVFLTVMMVSSITNPLSGMLIGYIYLKSPWASGYRYKKKAEWTKDEIALIKRTVYVIILLLIIKIVHGGWMGGKLGAEMGREMAKKWEKEEVK